MKTDTAGVIAPPPLIFLGGLAIGLAWHFVIGGDAIGLGALRITIASLALAIGIVLLVAAVRRFSAADTPPQPWEPTRAIVATGIYRFTRNPMYLGMAAVMLGLGLFADSIAALVMLVPVLLLVDRGVIRREERYLAAKFGAVYNDYRRTTRRWL
jgi:protein-S-isoprenylcysteine O-methyltransferase Ste14